MALNICAITKPDPLNTPENVSAVLEKVFGKFRVDMKLGQDVWLSMVEVDIKCANVEKS